MDGFDYIVVGGGSAGCVVAARLAQDPSARVLLLEAGGSERTRATTIPNAWPENLGSAAEWGDVTVPQPKRVRSPTRKGPDSWRIRRNQRNGPRPWQPRASTTTGRLRARRAGRSRTCCRTSGGPNACARARSGAPRPRRADTGGSGARNQPAPGRRRVRSSADRIGLASNRRSERAEPGRRVLGLAIADGERVSPADGYLRPMLGNPNLVVRRLPRHQIKIHPRQVHRQSLRTQRSASAGETAQREVILCAGRSARRSC